MREIKFRGKRTDNGQWVYGYYFQSPLTDENSGAKPEDGWFFLSGEVRHIISDDHVAYTVILETVGQYTGLKDKNNIEIYEDDILYCKKEDYTGIVKFDDGCFVTDAYGFGFEVIGGEMIYDIIGNIKENPELLEKRNDN